ncbi:hypothetical protein CEXT_624141 [Caerostris extrusa]|uniref:Uncharacterized protein n=1 Tax=Caerostris extrusa TaxID=172846 RepID=A0AAV4MYH4_CAEEX|nr:hypothetical protein CEXT_624141 [Caerostris extrusa]
MGEFIIRFIIEIYINISQIRKGIILFTTLPGRYFSKAGDSSGSQTNLEWKTDKKVEWGWTLLNEEILTSKRECLGSSGNGIRQIVGHDGKNSWLWLCHFTRWSEIYFVPDLFTNLKSDGSKHYCIKSFKRDSGMSLAYIKERTKLQIFSLDAEN